MKNKKILVTRKKDTFLIPGGKLKDNEKIEECLKREIREELGINVVSQRYFGEYEADAALDPGDKVYMEIFMVGIVGTPKALAEIAEIKYIDSKDIGKIKLGSVLEDYVIPELVKQNLIN